MQGNMPPGPGSKAAKGRNTAMDNDTAGAGDLALPAGLRGPLMAHLAALREAYRRRDWAGRVGFGTRPAVIVIDLARYWLDPGEKLGAPLDPVLEGARTVVQAARSANVPVFFTTYAADP